MNTLNDMKRRKQIEVSVEELYKRYLNGEGSSTLSKELGVNARTVLSWFKDKGYSIRSNGGSHFWTKEEMTEVYSLYKEGKNLREIEKLIGLNATSISKWFKRYGFELRESIVTKPRLLHHKNVDYFKNIDTDEKAYFLGLLYSDGCLKKPPRTYVIQLSLVSEDGYIVERLKDALAPTVPLLYYTPKGRNTREQTRLNVSSTKIGESLVALGMCPGKSYLSNLTFPDIPKEFYYSFIRGFFDGDGSASISISKNLNSSISRCVYLCCTSKNLLTKMQEILLTKNITSAIYPDYKNSKTPLFRLVINTKEGHSNFYNYLYTDTSCYLFRKKIALEMCMLTSSELRSLKAS